MEVGLKRWEIGEIASRIGQLYYNYYLRTSNAKFLSESFIFYEAIMSREYFKDSDKDASLANKQLRYCARFIVICLLLNRREMAHMLARQLRLLVDEYGHTYQVCLMIRQTGFLKMIIYSDACDEVLNTSLEMGGDGV
jgi:hypothetical protein